jgi:hypothetical protein
MNEFKKLLARLNYTKVKKILGSNADKLLTAGGRYDIDIDQCVEINDHEFILSTHGETTKLVYDDAQRYKLRIESSNNSIEDDTIGAMFSLLLEEKLALGLAEPPKERIPVESLSQEELIEQALKDRQERAFSEKMKVVSATPEQPWTDYAVTNHSSGKTYRVALRGFEKGISYCSCPDFKINTLGTCKHLFRVERYVKNKFKKAALSVPFKRERSSVSVCYLKGYPRLRFLAGKDLNQAGRVLLKPYTKNLVEDNFSAFARVLNDVTELGNMIHIHPDAERILDKKLFIERIEHDMKLIRANPTTHPLRTSLLNAELRPYQLDGIAFAVATGRSILADDMGLGKTIQGIGVAELFAREAGITKTLIICPASLKSQWREEINKFSNRSVQLILGSAEERAEQYDNEAFFTICNYEQVIRDTDLIERVKWDLIILDEGQRIKNWESLTSRTIKSLVSPFALVLSGTPMENRLEELFTIVSFIDHHRLGPAFRFLNTHRQVDERGKVLGYKKLDELRKKLQPVLLRRTREMVLTELPERNNQIIRIQPYDEQLAIDAGQRQIISKIICKKYLTEMDILRLQKALLLCRMAADSTYLVDKQQPHFSTKLETLRELLLNLLAEPDRKIIIFSEWTTMLDLIEAEAIPEHIGYVRLDGSVPQKKRGRLVNQFQTESQCRLFITTNAGSTGLNLQAANTVINIDLPWNPAILEQRIARAHRMGQQRPVDVYIMISEGMLEERILALLGAKKELAMAAVDVDSDIIEVSMQSGIEELKRRMILLIGGTEDKELDGSMHNEVNEEIKRSTQKRLANAGGQLLAAAFEFLGAAVNATDKTTNDDPIAQNIFEQFTANSDRDEDGKFKLNIALDESSLKNLSATLATIMQQNQ